MPASTAFARSGLVVSLGLAGWLLSDRPRSTEPLRVLRFEVRSYYLQDGHMQELPSLGSEERPAARQGDLVRVMAELNMPAYSYLIAFDPAGKEQPCYPSANAQQRPPEARIELCYPLGTTFYQLNDGPGLQAFVLVASRKPLPLYAEWRRQLGNLPWRAAEGQGAWRWDGQVFAPLGERQRGEVDVPIPPLFADLCWTLKAHSHTEMAVQAVLFPVQ